MSRRRKNNKSTSSVKPVNFSISKGPLIEGIPKVPAIGLRPSVAKFHVPYMGNVALGFYQIAKLQARTLFKGQNFIGRQKPLGHEKVKEMFRAHFAMGVNLALAAELYLKTILTVTGNNKNGHSLLELYDSISIFHRSLLDSIYKSMKPAKGSGISFSFSPRVDSNGQPVATPFLGDDADSIRKVIEYADSIFVKWRYAYEEPDKAFSLEYYTMRRLCIAMRKFLRIYISQSQKIPKVSFKIEKLI